MADVFLSYKKEDRALAEAAVAALERAGYSVWWDDRLTPIEHWDRLIEREIEAAKAVIVLWTARSIESDWVRIEANYAAEHAKLVQLRFGACRPPLAFSMLQRVDLEESAEPAGPAWEKALDWIALLTGRGEPQEQAQPPGVAQPAAGEGFEFNKAFGDDFSDIFDSLFGLKGDHGPETGDLFVPVVVTIAEAAVGKLLDLEPIEAVAKPEPLRVQLPGGLAPGDKVRLAGKGRERPDGGVGDLYLVVAVRDDTGFDVEGRHLRRELPVTSREASEGGERDVHLPWGAQLRVRIPPGITTGKTLRLAGYGLPGRAGGAPDGDLLLTLRVN